MGVQIAVFDTQENIEASDAVFSRSFNENLIHQLVVRYAAGARQGSKSQKTRSEVSGGGLKPWRQKGTGRARSGSTRSPIWRTGGVTFAAKPRSYEQKLNKKMFRAGIRSILSELIRQNRISVIKDFSVDSHKTKNLIDQLKLNSAERTLIIVDKISENLWLSSRNISFTNVLEASNLNPVLMVGADKVIVSSMALNQLEEIYRG